MQLRAKFWLKFSLFNLCIVAFLGVLMRYKIGFEFPYFNQKNLQHAHSHFAFSGWISHTLMILMVFYLQSKINAFDGNKYKKIIIANLICAYGMLVFFIYQGYGLFSIIFSTASVLVSYIFAYYFIKDLKLLDHNYLSKKWFKAAIFFNVISSLGTFYLAYMMASKNVIQDLYLSSVYYYLHFQYNGWFFFGCMGLLYGYLNITKKENSFYNTAFNLFTIACIPAYFLSTLWLNLPLWLYLITILAAVIQVFTWFKLLIVLLKTKSNLFQNVPILLRYLLLFIGFGLSVKYVLQLCSTVPMISQLAFGFRHIVMAYLHLIFLAIISLFFVFYFISNHLFVLSKKLKFGIILFAIGVFLNELVLAIEGIASFSYTLIPYADGLLFCIGLLLLIGIGLTTFYAIKKVKNNPSL